MYGGGKTGEAEGGGVRYLIPGCSTTGAQCGSQVGGTVQYRYLLTCTCTVVVVGSRASLASCNNSFRSRDEDQVCSLHKKYLRSI